MAVHILEQNIKICFERHGRLMHWLGPAFRGAIAVELKEELCVRFVRDGELPISCNGCQKQGKCLYAMLFEPPNRVGDFKSGWLEASRGVTICPQFPVSSESAIGATMDVELVVTGVAASNDIAMNILIDAIASAGANNGIGPDRIKFSIVDEGVRRRTIITPETLTWKTCDALIPSLTLDVVTPIFFRQSSEGKSSKQAVLNPEFKHYFMGSVRLISGLLADCGIKNDYDYADMSNVSKNIVMASTAYVSFVQKRWSSRSESGYDMRGVTGQAVFHNVPQCALNWLILGGKLHVGVHRVAGAGKWRITL